MVVNALSLLFSLFECMSRSWGNFDIPWIGNSEHGPIFQVLRNACKMMAEILENRGTQSTFGIRVFWCKYFYCILVNKENILH